MVSKLVGSDFQIGELTEGRSKCAYKLGFKLAVQLIAGEVLLYVTANNGEEKEGVGDCVGVNAGAANLYVNIQADFRVNYSKGNGVGCTELVIVDFLCVEVVNSLILAGVAAVGKTLAYGLKGFYDALA